MESLTMRKDECSEMGLGLSGNSSRLTFDPSLSVWLVWWIWCHKSLANVWKTWKELGHENVKAWANQSGPAKDKDLKSQAVIPILPVIFTYLYSQYHLIHGPTPVTPIRLFCWARSLPKPYEESFKGFDQSPISRFRIFHWYGIQWDIYNQFQSGILPIADFMGIERDIRVGAKKQDRAFLY